MGGSRWGKWVGRFGGTVAAAAACAGTPVPRYDTTVIESPSGYPIAVYGISGAGHVAGTYVQNHTFQEAFLWTPADGLITLPRLPGYQQAIAFDVNSRGQAVGRMRQDSGYSRAVLWQDGKLINLAGLPGGAAHEAVAINDRGQIVGFTRLERGIDRPFLWENGTVSELDIAPGENAEPYDINNDGIVVGSMGDFSRSRAFRWQDGKTTTLPGVSAHAINDRGQIIVEDSIPSEGGPTIFRTYLWEAGTLTDLGVLPGMVQTRAWDITGDGVIAGSSSVPSGPFDAFVWQEGVMHDGNELLCILDVMILGFYAANEHGAIGGAGLMLGEPAGIVMHPVEEPPGDVDRDGAVTLGDLSALLDAWGWCPGPPVYCPADLDCDYRVGITDLLLLMWIWGP
jgi:probable HAF family extracellular repeat protein